MYNHLCTIDNTIHSAGSETLPDAIRNPAKDYVDKMLAKIIHSFDTTKKDLEKKDSKNVVSGTYPVLFILRVTSFSSTYFIHANFQAK